MTPIRARLATIAAVAVVFVTTFGLVAGTTNVGALPPDGGHPAVTGPLEDKADGNLAPPRTAVAPVLSALPRCVLGASTYDRHAACNSDADATLPFQLDGNEAKLHFDGSVHVVYPFTLMPGTYRCLQLKVSSYATAAETDTPIVRSVRQCEGVNVFFLADFFHLTTLRSAGIAALHVEVTTAVVSCGLWCSDAGARSAASSFTSGRVVAASFHFRD